MLLLLLSKMWFRMHWPRQILLDYLHGMANKGLPHNSPSVHLRNWEKVSISVWRKFFHGTWSNTDLSDGLRHWLVTTNKQRTEIGGDQILVASGFLHHREEPGMDVVSFSQQTKQWRFLAPLWGVPCKSDQVGVKPLRLHLLQKGLPPKRSSKTK